MAGFRKAKAEQAALKIGFYGAAGSGKTFTALLVAEGLAKREGKRIAFVDTERGTDFYSQKVPDRQIHPEAFDFDALYTRSLTETLNAVKGVSPSQYSVLIIDSITHLWEAARAAYTGKTTSAGTIPFHAWGKIKRPYKQLVNYMLSSPMHIIICGRQGNEFAEDEDSGELKNIGYKMKAESETPYEPHILIRMEAVKQGKGKDALITAFAEKDRTGVLAGKTIVNPTFENLAGPILPLLGGRQAKMQSEEEASSIDVEAFSEADTERLNTSKNMLDFFSARLRLAKSAADVKAIGKEITPQTKKEMISEHLSELRQTYLEIEAKFPAIKKPEKKQDVPDDIFNGKPKTETTPVTNPPQDDTGPKDAPDKYKDNLRRKSTPRGKKRQIMQELGLPLENHKNYTMKQLEKMQSEQAPGMPQNGSESPPDDIFDGKQPDTPDSHDDGSERRKQLIEQANSAPFEIQDKFEALKSMAHTAGYPDDKLMHMAKESRQIPGDEILEAYVQKLNRMADSQ